MTNPYSRKCFVVSFALILILFIPSISQAAQNDSDDFLKSFIWREIGPANPGGRITDIEGVASNPSIIYAGAATGASGKPPMRAPPGSRYSTINRMLRSATSQSPYPIPIPSSLGPENRTTATAHPGEAECSNPLMPEKPGNLPD